MKHLVAFAVCLFGTVSLWGQSQLAGSVKNPDGSGFNGRLIFSLAQAGSASTVSPCTGPALVVPVETVTVQVSSGTLVSPPILTSSVCTIPIGIPYNVIAVDSNGNVAFTDQWLVSGSTFDVGTAVSSGDAPTVSYKGLWSATTTYSVGDIVAYGSAVPVTYVSLVSNNIANPPSSSSSDWQVLNGVSEADSALNIAGGVLGSIPYQSAPSTTSFLAPNTTTTPCVLTETGTGTVGTAPTCSQGTAFSNKYGYPGAEFIGDSIACGEGASNFSGTLGTSDVNSNGVPNNGWTWLVGDTLGGSPTVRCQGGATLTDMITTQMLTTYAPQYAQQPTAFGIAGINDANQYGTGTGALANWNAELGAITAYFGTPNASAAYGYGGKVFGQNCTLNPYSTGTIASSSLGNVLGVTMNSTGDNVSCSITTGGGPLAIVYRVIDSNSTGTASVSIDGGTAFTLTSSGFGGQAITSAIGTTQTEFAYMVTGLSAATHTISITRTGSTVFGFDYVATPYFGPPVVGMPRFVFSGPSYWAGNAAAVTTYYTSAQSDMATYSAQGWPVMFADIRSELNSTTDVQQTSTTCRDGSTNAGSLEAGHPNDCGYMAIRDVVLNTIGVNPMPYYQQNPALAQICTANCTLASNQTLALAGSGVTVTLPIVRYSALANPLASQVVTVLCTGTNSSACTVAVPSGWVLAVSGANNLNGTLTLQPKQSVSFFAQYGPTYGYTWYTLGGLNTPAFGGTGINSSTYTGIAQVNAGAWSINPVLPQAISSTTTSLPLTSGSSTSNFFTRSYDSAGSRTLDSGVSPSNGAWLQSRDINTYAVNYPLMLQPNGGDVLIGTSTDCGYSLCVTSPSLITPVITGVTNGSSAAAGTVGETLSCAVAVGSAVSLTTATPASVCSISLSAGAWMLVGNVDFSATTVTTAVGSTWSTGIYPVVAIPTTGREVPLFVPALTTTSFKDGRSIAASALSVSAVTPVYLVGEATFTAGTVGGYGSMTAIRIR